MVAPARHAPNAGTAAGGASSSDAADAAAFAMDLELPPPMRQQETAAEVAERRARKQRELKKAEAMQAAGSEARERLSERSGPNRSTLFDVHDFQEQTAAKSKAMEATYAKLYKPTAGAYWTAKRNGTQPPVRPVHSRPQVDLVPTYARQLPSALSLSHPAFRAMDELNGDDPAEPAGAEPAAGAAEEPFDPMAEPVKFFKNFKERVGSLRADIAAPPRALEPARPAATAASLPPPPERPAAAPPATAARPPEPKKPASPLPFGGLPPEPESDYAVDVDEAPIYLTALGGAEADAQLPMWDAPGAPWGASWDEPLRLQ